MEPINQGALQQDQYFLVMSAGLLARAERSYISHKNSGESRYEVENTKQTKSKEGASTQAGKQAGKHLCFNPILVAERVPFAEYINPRGQLEKHAFLSLLAKIKCSICSYLI